MDFGFGNLLRAVSSNLLVARIARSGMGGLSAGVVPRGCAGHWDARGWVDSRGQSVILGCGKSRQVVCGTRHTLGRSAGAVALGATGADFCYAKFWLYLDGSFLRGDFAAGGRISGWLGRAFFSDPLASGARAGFLLRVHPPSLCEPRFSVVSAQ